MDKTDALLLNLLAQNADATTTELVPLVKLSVPAINKRIVKLKASGIIRRATVLTDAKQVGKPIIAYVLVILDQFSNAKNLIKYVESDVDVLECYAVTGEYDFLLKICAADIEAFESKLINLKQSRSVAKSYTLLTLMEHKFSPVALPDPSLYE